MIAALAWLGVRALHSNPKPTAVTVSRFENAVRSGGNAVRNVTVDQSRQSLSATINGQKVIVDYPAQALPGLEDVMKAHNVTYTPKSSGGTSAWWDILEALLPLALLIAFWINLTKNSRARRARA